MPRAVDVLTWTSDIIHISPRHLFDTLNDQELTLHVEIFRQPGNMSGITVFRSTRVAPKRHPAAPNGECSCSTLSCSSKLIAEVGLRYAGRLLQLKCNEWLLYEQDGEYISSCFLASSVIGA